MVAVGARAMVPQETARLPASKARHAHKKFSNKDLPAGTLDKWRQFYIPMWTDYIGTRLNPWDTDLLEPAQELWDKIFPMIPRKLTTKGPIFQLVSFSLLGLSNDILIYLGHPTSIRMARLLCHRRDCGCGDVLE